MTPRRMYSLVALAVLIGGSAISYARMATNDSRVIPYSGTLQTGAAVANGDYQMRFGLFPSAVADASCLLSNPASCSLWGEEQDVLVSAGSFSVALGDVVAITDTHLAQNQLFLAIAVKADSDVGYTLLDDKQEILPAPWASRAAAAVDYKITGNATVGGSVSAASFRWGAAGVLDDNQGASVELGGSGTPFIDFKNDLASDFDARLRLTGDDELSVEGARLALGASGLRFGNGTVLTAAPTCTCFSGTRVAAGAGPIVATAVLPLGYQMTGGGCHEESDGERQLLSSHATTATTWYCKSQDETDAKSGGLTPFVCGCAFP